MSDSYILEIKNKRKDFINSFEKNIENIDNELIRASNDNQLNSIRIHKYLTEARGPQSPSATYIFFLNDSVVLC